MNRKTPVVCSKDWHSNYQDEDYLHLSLQRMGDESPPLHWCVQFADIIRKQALSILPGGGLTINDIGCNVGHFCRVLSELQCDVIYHGYDISETYLDFARTRYPQKSFGLLDISMERPEQEADVSIISATLEHIEQWESALSNIIDSTRQLVLLRSFFGLQPASDMYKKAQAIHPYLIRQFTFEQVARLAERHGFSTRFVRDSATDSIPQFLGCGITRTQYIAIISKDKS